MGKTTAFDAADYLDSEDMMAEYLNQRPEAREAVSALQALGVRMYTQPQPH